MAEATETSPLLTVENNHIEASGSGGNNITSFPEITAYTPAKDFFPRSIRILTISILVISILSFIVLISNDILISYAPFRWHPYTTGQSLEAVVAFIIIAFIAAIINLRVKPPILINFVIDVFLLWGFVVWLPELVFPSYGWCQDRYSPKPISPKESVCVNFVTAAWILMVIGGGLATLAAAGHFVLLALRCAAAWRSKFWRRPSGLRVPTGELTFQITIKLLRQETAVPAAKDTGVSIPQ